MLFRYLFAYSGGDGVVWRIRVPLKRSVREVLRQRLRSARPGRVRPARDAHQLINMRCTQCQGQGIAVQTRRPCDHCGGSGFC